MTHCRNHQPRPALLAVGFACLLAVGIFRPLDAVAQTPQTVQEPSKAERLSQLERDFWAKTRTGGTLAEMEAFVQAFPNSIFIPLAKKRIEQLKAAQPPKATDPPAPVTSSAYSGISPEVLALIAEVRALRAMVDELKAARPQGIPLAVKPLAGRALVIGNGNYAYLGKLPNPANDAEAIAAKLRAFGFQVTLVLDGDRDSMARALTDSGRAATGSDVSLLFYAGHAVQLDGENYLLPVNAKLENATPGYIKLTGLPLAAVIENLPTKTRLIFIDACRDNPLSRIAAATRTVIPKGLAPAESISGTLIAYATKDGSTAEDGAGRHSPYTAALLQHLDRAEDIGVILRRVRMAVMESTRDRQQPWEYGSLVGEQLVLSTMFRGGGLHK